MRPFERFKRKRPREPVPPDRLPPPHLAALGYERVGYWLLKAKAAPGTATDYNKAVGSLWAACTSTRTLPSPKQFAHDLAAIRHKQDTAYARATVIATRLDLERATAALNNVEHEASLAGLLA